MGSVKIVHKETECENFRWNKNVGDGDNNNNNIKDED